jgi:hypothetical protein
VPTTYAYHQPILDALARHGLVPLPSTPPSQLRDALRDLYKYEIRVLKERLLAGGIERRNYAAHVIELRKGYWLLSVPTELWLLTSDPPTDAGESTLG